MNDLVETKTVDSTMLDHAFIHELDHLMAMANQYRRTNDQKQAVACYRMILQHAPNHADANFGLGQVLLQSGDMEKALPYIEAAIQSVPTESAYWNLYLKILRIGGIAEVVEGAEQLRAQYIQDDVPQSSSPPVEMDQRLESASLSVAADIKNIVKQVAKTGLKEIQPNKKHAFPVEVNKLVNLYQKEQLKELEHYARKLLSKNKFHGFAWRFLGIALLDLGRASEALPCSQKALSYLPNDPIAHFNLAQCCKELKLLGLAEKHYRMTISLNPVMLEAYNNLGNLLLAMGRLDDAEACFRNLIAQKADFALAHINLTNVLHGKGAYWEAKLTASEGVRLAPTMADAHNSLGSTLYKLKEYDTAIVHFQRAIELRPSYVEPYNNLGIIFFEKNQFTLAKPYFEKCMELNSTIGSIHRVLGFISYCESEPIDKSMRYIRKALELDPNDHDANSLLLFLMSEVGIYSPTELFQEHRRFGERVETKLIADWPAHENDRSPNRKLSIGFISGDFYNHAVATFITPILSHLKTQENISLYAYDNNEEEDSVTAILRTKFHSWKKIHTLSDIEVVKKIQEDKIDILFDLSGHTGKNRLVVFAHKPAPVQITWIGYPGTTGLTAMDYYFTDRYFLPEKEFDHLFLEKLVRLPASAPFLPYERSPEINALPAISNGYVTFGSFNRPGKISDAVISVWARLLKNVPTSKMVLGAMPSDGNFDRISNTFLANGIERDRLIFFGRCGMDLYLNQLQKVDICLDTFPYNGGTTTLHGLWMGVPTLTKVGSTVAGRTGICILSHVGLQKFSAKTDDEFVKEGIYWSENLKELAALRASLRDRLGASPVRHPNLIAASVVDALRVMWQKWCIGSPPESFEISAPRLSKK